MLRVEQHHNLIITMEKNNAFYRRQEAIVRTGLAISTAAAAAALRSSNATTTTATINNVPTSTTRNNLSNPIATTRSVIGGDSIPTIADSRINNLGNTRRLLRTPNRQNVSDDTAAPTIDLAITTDTVENIQTENTTETT